MAKLPFMTGRYKWFLKVLSVCAEFKGEDPDAECRRPTSAKEYNITTDNPALLEKTGIEKSADKKVKIYTPVKTHFYNEKSSKLPFMAGCYEWFFKALPVCECKSEDPNAEHRKPTSKKGNGLLCPVYNWMYPEADRKNKDCKVFNDPIHGHIELHPLLVRIIDTPEFQRLRYIKQLGGGYFVYPGASHNRFEHSIGVAHLAGKLAEALKSKQSKELDEIEEKLKEEETEELKSKQAELKKSLISDRDVLCVQIAGLCHDMGHGPFSHVFDGMFNPEADPEADPEHEDWKHEDASVAMFDHLVKNNSLEQEMKDYGLELPTDLTFIQEMIKPEKSDGTKWPHKGRDKEKTFLYEIVSNKQNGIDVDKFDYFDRDCHHLGIKNNFDHQRFIMFARVCEVEGQKHICSRKKEMTNLYGMFHTRDSLHRRAYQHRVTKSVEIMIKDALLKVHKHPCFKIKGKTFDLAKAKKDMEAYANLTDQVIEQILHHGPCSCSNESTPSPLQEAAQILQRIMCRDLYQCVGELKVKGNEQEKIEKIKETLKKELAKAIPKDGKQDEQDNFEIFVAKFDYGMKNEDPISDYTYFYEKSNPTVGFKIPKEEMSDLLPKHFSEKIIRVYWKKDDKSLENAKKCFSNVKSMCWASKQEENNDDSKDTPGDAQGI
ncbi:deoxynucleoside triphosphate triphosphohydrolase SAMHD1-like [Archocentrus centrarchus]|uniref:deoxynucleoside triphosphate triphosphohydrolase SAMHD1-like n=1 Tax=Archocentrus centrarchus TaxID=63155 RepID=UPI0011EA0494|nr:deoxynucleoside triphosphate triphosphohydrolase SAMHD1-like [Archocentrus centrarchus]